MIRVYIVRHGETLCNIQKITQGWGDSPLTERGLLQAKMAGGYKFKFHHIGNYTTTQHEAATRTKTLL